MPAVPYRDTAGKLFMVSRIIIRPNMNTTIAMVAISVKIGQYSELFVIFVRNVPTGDAHI